MTEVLSQAEIDALLTAINDGNSSNEYILTYTWKRVAMESNDYVSLTTDQLTVNKNIPAINWIKALEAVKKLKVLINGRLCNE